MYWYKQAFKDCFNFSGRAGRPEYWIFTLVNAVIIILLYLGLFISFGENHQYTTLSLVLHSIIFFYFFIALLPAIAVTVRRLHDTDRSGWWILLGFVPFASLFLVLVVSLKSNEGSNRFGNRPTKLTRQLNKN